MAPRPAARARLAAIAIGLALAGAAAAPARAGEPGVATRWSCWYDQAQHLACLVAVAGITGPQDTLAAGRHPLPAVAELRSRPERWRGRIVRIPMHTEPLDEAFTAELAQSVLCGSQRDCKADYSRQPVFSLQAMADLADMHDDLLQSRD